MTHDPKRRQAFAEAFKDYPLYLMQFVNNHAMVVSPEGGEPPMLTATYKNSMALICFAQFLTRLIRTRCTNTGPDLVGFGMVTAGRYNDFKRKLIGDYEIIADDKYTRAINAIEQAMVNLIFEALTKEVEIDMQAKEKGNFYEEVFWVDIFNAFKMTQRENHPLWGTALRAVILPHMAEFKKALEADNAKG